MRKTMAKKKLTYDTASKIVSETFLSDVVQSVNRDKIKSILIDAEKSLRQIIDAENDDMQLAAARELASNLGKGYREASKNEQAKIVVCLNRLEELGD